MGKRLSDATVIKEAAKTLAAVVVPSDDPHQGSVAYRKSLVQALLFKARIFIKDITYTGCFKSPGRNFKYVCI